MTGTFPDRTSTSSTSPRTPPKWVRWEWTTALTGRSPKCRFTSSCAALAVSIAVAVVEHIPAVLAFDERAMTDGRALIAVVDATRETFQPPARLPRRSIA